MLKIDNTRHTLLSTDVHTAALIIIIRTPNYLAPEMIELVSRASNFMRVTKLDRVRIEDRELLYLNNGRIFFLVQDLAIILKQVLFAASTFVSGLLQALQLSGILE